MHRSQVRNRCLAALLVAGVAVLLAACGSSSSSTNSSAGTSSSGSGGGSKTSGKQLKVAAMYLSKFDAESFGQSYLDAFAQVKKNTGVDIHLVENVPYTSQLTQAAERLLGPENYDLVIDANAGGSLFYAACKQFPQKACIENYPVGARPANTGGYWFDSPALYYVEGAQAGMLTKSNTIGFVNPFKSPANNSFMNAFALGCQSVNPQCKMRNVYVNSYFDPPKEIEATNTLINSGADVVGHVQDDDAVLNTANKRGVWSYGIYAAPKGTPPAKYVTAQLQAPTLAAIFTQQIKALQAGKWATEAKTVNYGTPKPLDMDLATWGPNVPQNVKDKGDQLVKKIDGGWTPFQGPIYDATGKLRVPAGSSLPIRGTVVVSSWVWPVKGIIGG